MPPGEISFLKNPESPTVTMMLSLISRALLVWFTGLVGLLSQQQQPSTPLPPSLSFPLQPQNALGFLVTDAEAFVFPQELLLESEFNRTAPSSFIEIYSYSFLQSMTARSTLKLPFS